MNIGLNLLHARPEIGGGWNYIQNIIETIDELDDSNLYWCYCTSDSECLVPSRANFRKVVAGSWVRTLLGRVIMENTLLQYYAIRDRLDFMYWFTNARAFISCVRSVVTVYDLGAFGAHQNSGFLNFMRKAMISFSARYATVLTPISQSTENALVREFAVERARCVVIPHPIGPEYAPASSNAVSDFRKAYSLPAHFWLYVAHYYPHKNHCKLFKAYRIYQSQVSDSWPLVLRCERNGADAFLEKKIRQEGIQDCVIWLPRLRLDEMRFLYSAATALVFPSLFEGGGIPVMEAMACGCPVIASDIPTTREFAGEAAFRFDPNSATDIAEKMLMFAKDDALGERLRTCGFKQVANLRRDVVFSKILQAYDKAIGSPEQ